MRSSEPLDGPPDSGFGGVAEYGITVRWDKNFLDINYCPADAPQQVPLLDGVRFGGTIDDADAWDLGFDHIGHRAPAPARRPCADAERPRRGMRTASDFLMALQGLTAPQELIANLQIEVPVVVSAAG